MAKAPRKNTSNGNTAAPVAINTILLAAIADASATDPGYRFVSLADLSGLLNTPHGSLVEQNPEITNASGEIATRITDAGRAFLTASQGTGNTTMTNTATAPAAAKPAFEVETGIALPPVTRGGFGGERGSQYPFATMPVGSSFHVPVTEAMADPNKALTSTVSAMTTKYLPKCFVIRKAAVDDPKGPGARVFRVADLTDEQIATRNAKTAARVASRKANADAKAAQA